MSVLLALLASGLWGTSDFLGGTLSRRLHVLTVVGVSQGVALVALGPVALVLGGAADRGFLLPGLLAGLVGLGALSAFYRALATGTMGVVAPVAALGAAVPVVIGVAGGEAPSGRQLLGVVVAVVGVVLASGPELGGRGGRGGALPLGLAAVAAVGFGSVIVLVADGARSSVVLTLLTMRLTTTVVLAAVLLAVLARGGEPPRVGRADLPLLAGIGLADVGANGLFAVAASSQGALVSVTGVLASLYPVVTVLLARQVLGERLRSVQVAGVAVALGGVVGIAAG